MLAVCLLLAAAGSLAQERDKKAVRLAAKGAKLAAEAKPIWKAFVDDPSALTMADLTTVIDAYESAIDRFHESLEIEEHSGINGQILSLARRLAKLRFEEMTREARARQAAREQRQEKEESKKPDPKPEPEEPQEKRGEPEEPGESEDADEPDPPDDGEQESEEPRRFVLPELIEPPDVARRNTQRLRNFLMHEYFANRKFAKLVVRCSRCNGGGKVRTGRLDKYRRPITKTCPGCNGSGALLKEEAARKGFWLVMSPLYRSDPDQAAFFAAQLEGWRADPRTIPEFLKSFRILSIDNHGLWATAVYSEKGYTPGNKRTFHRKVKRMFVRLGRRWYVFDEEADAGIFEPDPDEDD